MSSPKPFSDEIIKQAWERSRREQNNLKPNEGMCECTHLGCNSRHNGLGPRHNRILHWGDRGNDDISVNGWEAHHIDPDGEPTLDNCKILCCECHKATPSYGKHK